MKQLTKHRGYVSIIKPTPTATKECRCGCHKRMQTCDLYERKYLINYCCKDYQIIKPVLDTKEWEKRFTERYETEDIYKTQIHPLVVSDIKQFIQQELDKVSKEDYWKGYERGLDEAKQEALDNLNFKIALERNEALDSYKRELVGKIRKNKLTRVPKNVPDWDIGYQDGHDSCRHEIIKIITG